MPDYAKIMKDRIEKYQAANPEMSLLFISSRPDMMEDSLLDGWKPLKAESGEGGSAGEVRVGDLILAARPRAMSEEEREKSARKAAGSLPAIEMQFARDLETAGSRYVQPLNQRDLDFNRKG